MRETTGFPEDFKVDAYLFYDAIEKSTDNYIYIVDMEKDVALVSKNMENDFELPGRIVKGLIPIWGDLIHKRDQERYYDSIDMMLNNITSEHNVEYQIRNRMGEYMWVVCRGQLQRDLEGNPIMFAGVVTNLSNRGKVDHTTGLFTQKECKILVESILEEESSFKAGILLLGLDDFAGINDLKSHVFGDAVLRQFAQDIQRLLPRNAVMYRFDGDEFAIIFKDTSCDEIFDFYRKIRTYSNQEHVLDDISYVCFVSGGIAMIGRDAGNFSDLIKFADSALKSSKLKGKNTCTIYTEDLLFPKLRFWEIKSRLRNCVLNGMEGFYLVYQPLSHAADLTVTGAEALLRWQDKELGAVTPDEFIPSLEESGLIVPAGKWIFDKAVSQCKKWVEFCPSFVLNINISYLQMLDDSFVDMVLETLQRHELDPSHIVLELTESHFVTDMDSLKLTFDRLRSQNIHLAMDDFGTGYSSLGLLSATPADIVKIDRIFISSINDKDHAFNRTFIGAVIQLCHSVGISVCVEGVEYEPELDMVRSLQADSIQGFYISRPIPSSEFEEKYWNR